MIRNPASSCTGNAALSPRAAELPGTAGWSLSADEDIFTREQLIEAFDVKDVLSNPARFDQKKAEAINGTHVRMLEPQDFRDRLVPYLQAAGLVGEELSEREAQILDAAAPLVQERVGLLGEAADMMAFLFLADEQITVDEKALKGMPANLGEVVQASIQALEPLTEWSAAAIQEACGQSSSRRWN